MNCSIQTILNTALILLYTTVLMFPAIEDACARKSFYIERPKLGLKLSYETEEEKRTGPYSDTKDVTHEYKERLEITTKGWIYHPALCTYNLQFEPEWSQLKEEHKPGQNDSKNSYLPGYFADATFLNRKPYTLQLFGNRREYTVRSAFTGKSKSLTDMYGANLMLKYRLLPTTLRYTHRDGTQTGFYTSEDENDDFRISTNHSTQKSASRLKVAFNQNRRSNQGITTRTKTSNSDFQNTYHITTDRKIWLQSYLSGRKTESDLYASSGVRLSENLYWKHKQNLRSDYRFNYDRSKSGGSDNESKSFGAGLTHSLYENLTTKIAGKGSVNNYTSGTEKIYGADLHFDYRRKIPWGSLYANAGYDYESTIRDFDDNTIQVTGESHKLKTGEVTLLNNERVDSDSITVTDGSRTTVYIENIDYRIDKVGFFFRISRIVSGSISDGEEVLVDYRYLKDTDYDDAVLGQSYGIGCYLWSALRLFYSYHTSKQKILSGTPPDMPINDTSQSAKMQLDWKWSETTLTYDDSNRSSGISTSRWSAEETLTIRPLIQLFFRLSALYGNTRFKDNGDSEAFFRLRSNIDWVPARWCKLSLESIRNDVSGDLQKIRDIDISASIELFYRIWSCRIKYDIMDTKDTVNAEKRISQTVLFEIVRIPW